MRPALLLLFISIYIELHAQQPCDSIVLPSFSATVKADYEQKLADAKLAWEKDSLNADALIWYGRRTAYLGNYMEAIQLFSKGIAQHSGDARFYRHRGHRYITVRCFDKAIADFEKAAALVKGKSDEIEPDGMPNARNTPTSTLQSNIWYHLGLAYYLQGNFKKAAGAYKSCLAVSKNNDMYVATANWYYITLRGLKRNKDAAALLATIDPAMDLIENKDYLEILLLYKNGVGVSDPMQLMQEQSGLRSATFGYGLAMYCLLSGVGKEKTKQVLEKVLESGQWAGFGFIAAEAAIKKL